MKTAWFGLIALVPALAAPLPVRSAGGEIADTAMPASTIEISFNLYMGGISLGRVDLEAQVRDGSYKAASRLETSAVVNAIWRAKMEATSDGTFDASRPKPAIYEAFSVHRATNNQRQQVTLNYGQAGIPAVRPNPPYRSNVPVADEQKRQTVDPVSALVGFVTSYDVNREKPCTQVAPVYDGRRRYDVTLSFVKNDTVRMDSGLYNGPVNVCRLRYTHIAGARQRILEGDRVPDIFGWITSLPTTSDPERHFVLPLRIWAQTDYGLFVALASKVTIDGKPLGRPS